MGIGTVSKCAAFVAIALLATEGGVAAAHTFDAESQVTMHYKAEKERFQGRVTSDRSSCLRNRTVVIYRQTPAEDPAVGLVVTNRNGFWKAQEVVRPDGAFYARVLRRARTPDGHRHLCEADRSQTLDLGGSRAPQQAR